MKVDKEQERELSSYFLTKPWWGSPSFSAVREVHVAEMNEHD
jgi:hypothetical protein